MGGGAATGPLPEDHVRRVHFWATGIRRAALDDAGGFDEAYTAGGAYGNEDIEFGCRLLKRGAAIRWALDAKAMTEACTDTDELLDRWTDIGRNDLRLATTHPETVDILIGRKVRGSRAQRAVARILAAVPLLARFDLPLRLALQWAVRAGQDGPMTYRLWLVAQSVRYWDGVIRGGGRPVLRAALRG